LPASLTANIDKRDQSGLDIRFEGSVLLMDDEDGIRDVAGEMLNHLGLQVAYARDGMEAIDIYEKAMHSGHKFDVVILDLTVPGGMGGSDTMQALLKMDPDIKAIVSSGYSTDKIMADFQTYGFKACMVKPYKLNELTEVLQKVIEARRSPDMANYSNKSHSRQVEHFV